MEFAVGWMALLKLIVEILLISAVNRLCKCNTEILRILGAAVFSAIFSVACLIEGFKFLANPIWKILSLTAFVLIAFGINVKALHRGAVYLLLAAAIGSLTSGGGSADMRGVLEAAISICVMCVFVTGERGTCTDIPVELSYNGKSIKLNALHDTGNMLTDPISGKPVLVIDANAAEELTGLTSKQLHSPTETICAGLVPGLRLIPYKTIGSKGGFLLALKLNNVRIGSWRGSSLVAFAPEAIENRGKYQALTGGII